MVIIKKGKNKEFYFVVLAKNKKVIATSETYKTKAGCLKGVKSLSGILSQATVVKEEISETKQLKTKKDGK